MGQKSRKKPGAGSAAKSKNLEVSAPIVALPAAFDGEAITSNAANSTGEAMAGEFGDIDTVTGMENLNKQVDEQGGATTVASLPGSSPSFDGMVTAKSTSTNWKVLKEAKKLKKSVSFAGNLLNLNGTEVEKTGNSTRKVQPAENSVSIANSNAGNAGITGSAAYSFSEAVNAGISSSNAQNLHINSKLLAVID